MLQLHLASVFIALLLTWTARLFVGASAIPVLDSQVVMGPITPTERVTIGWKGLQTGSQIRLEVSGGGELGKVFYVADGTDLAQFFATTGTHVCEITVDAVKWRAVAKHWVTPEEIESHRGAGQMDALYPNNVIFAWHVSVGIADKEPWQLGIRQHELTNLGLQGTCYKKTDSYVKNKKINYPNMSGPTLWNIQGQAKRRPGQQLERPAE